MQRLRMEVGMAAAKSKIKYLTTEYLAMRRVKVNCELKQGIRYPVIRSYLHNDIEVRAEIGVSESGRTAMVTLPLEVFNGLPTVTV